MQLRCDGLGIEEGVVHLLPVAIELEDIAESERDHVPLDVVGVDHGLDLRWVRAFRHGDRDAGQLLERLDVGHELGVQHRPAPGATMTSPSPIRDSGTSVMAGSVVGVAS